MDATESDEVRSGQRLCENSSLKNKAYMRVLSFEVRGKRVPNKATVVRVFLPVRERKIVFTQPREQ